MKLVECVPNFSEGRDKSVIDAISKRIKSIEGVVLLDVDSGIDTNRTVMTMVGDPKSISNAAFEAIKVASDLIDMSKHHGSHSRIGATDVCPIIPISEISIKECIELSENLAKRVGEELNIPVFLYEKSAKDLNRVNLANIRKGEYEGLAQKLNDIKWKPDFGPSTFNKKSGATVIGVRDFLIAYNINLNTTNVRIATDIAFEIREKGRSKRKPNPKSPILLDGEIIRDKKGAPIKKSGLFKDVKAVGWYVDEFKCAQISINFNNYKKSTIHEVFDKVCELANERGVRVTGSELVGLIPLDAMLMAGTFFLSKQRSSNGIPENDIINIVTQSLGLNDVTPFDPRKKIIEYAIKGQKNNLMDMKVSNLLDEFSRKSIAPGGGSASAITGAFGASLCSMVAAISFEKYKSDKLKTKMLKIGNESQKLMKSLSFYVDEDSNAFKKTIKVSKLPEENEELKKIKFNEIAKANKYSAEIPLCVAKNCRDLLKIAKVLSVEGYVPSLCDVNVASELLMSGIKGAVSNVKVNIPNIKDKLYIKRLETEIKRITKESELLLSEINHNFIESINSDEL